MNSDERPFPCSQCTYRAKYKSHLTRHISSVHLREKKHFCQYCSYGSNEKRTLDLHVLTIHKEIRPYACDKCDKTYAQRGNLVTHIANVHDSDLKLFNCEFCPFRALRTGDIKLHVQQTHQNKKRFCCTQCDFSSYLRSNLKQHIQSKHNNDTSHYKCEFCPYTCTNYVNFMGHKLTHTRGKYACEYCSYKTNYENKLQEHVNAKHSNNSDTNSEGEDTSSQLSNDLAQSIVNGETFCDSLELFESIKNTDDSVVDLDLLKAYGLG